MPQATQTEIHYIQTQADLEKFCRSLEGAPYLAIDTEFVRDRTYYPRLCLIQIASDSALACIDPLSITDLTPVKHLLLDQQILKVFHAARQDLEVLFNEFAAVPQPIFDTQLAATLLGLGEQIGYANLVKQILNIQLGKQHSRTDWERRPLSQEQIEYAADDVRYLVQIYPVITTQLKELGREQWLNDDLRQLTDEQLYQSAGHDLWLRVSGYQKLRRKQLAVLRELAMWREQQAQQLNKPRKWIIQDNLLIAIATQAPTSQQKLASVRGLNESFLSKYSEQLLEIIHAALASPQSDWPVAEKRRPLSKQQDALIDCLMAITKLKAEQHQLNISAITNRSQLEKLVLGEHDLDLLSGWRRELVGHSLLEFLRGTLALTCEDDTPVLIEQR